jgi:hypothetical protein
MTANPNQKENRMQAKPTDIRDARVCREMNVPLNTPVVHAGRLPAVANKAMKEGFEAAIKFRKAIYDYGSNQTEGKCAAMYRAYERFMKKTEHADELAASILESEFGSIRTEWTEAFERLNAGEPVDVQAMWPCQETEASKRRNRNPSL